MYFKQEISSPPEEISKGKSSGKRIVEVLPDTDLYIFNPARSSTTIYKLLQFHERR